jgi:predicted TIM-barrel fold metal-dependent hydrolase
MLAGAVDVHAHYLPVAYRDALDRAQQLRLDGNALPPPRWSPGEHLDAAASLGIATSMLSISSPGLLLSDDTADVVDLARRVNEQGADLVRTHPDHFGLLASLPLPDVPAGLRELERALDELGADGISLMTNYQGVYLGSEAFATVFDELSRRQAVVALHPTSPRGWQATSLGRSRGMLDFMFETARAVFDLILSGTLDRCPGVRVIVPHTGGVITVIADRVDRSRLFGEPSQVDVFAALDGLLYDLSGEPLPRVLPALLRLVATPQLVYGSDFPFHPQHLAQAMALELATSGVLDDAARRAAAYERAYDLFPRLGDQRRRQAAADARA